MWSAGLPLLPRSRTCTRVRLRKSLRTAVQATRQAAKGRLPPPTNRSRRAGLSDRYQVAWNAPRYVERRLIGPWLRPARADSSLEYVDAERSFCLGSPAPLAFQLIVGPFELICRARSVGRGAFLINCRVPSQLPGNKSQCRQVKRARTRPEILTASVRISCAFQRLTSRFTSNFDESCPSRNRSTTNWPQLGHLRLFRSP